MSALRSGHPRGATARGSSRRTAVARVASVIGAGICAVCGVGGSDVLAEAPDAEDDARSPEARADEAASVARGAELFRLLCAGCHGERGAGDGPAAEGLDVAPADLRVIAASNGGMFIPGAVAAFIDGRRVVAEHGPREMPTWGRTLDDRNIAIGEERKLGPAMIGDLVAFLRTIQIAEAPDAEAPDAEAPNE